MISTFLENEFTERLTSTKATNNHYYIHTRTVTVSAASR